jgi:chromosome segregation ATPase
MKNFHQNLLLFLSFCLCGLCIYQWYVLSTQRGTIDKLAHTVSAREGALLAASNTIRTADHQIAQMDADLAELQATNQTDRQRLDAQDRQLAQLQTELDARTNLVAEYTQTITALEAKLKDAYSGITRQNEALRQVAAQRDEFVAKYNAGVKDRNDIVAKYNDLVKQIEKQQAPSGGSPPSGGRGK